MESSTQSFGKLFLEFSENDYKSNKTFFYIPSFQRCYSWTKSDIAIFFEDLLSFSQRNNKSKEFKKWFLGCVIVFDENQNELNEDLISNIHSNTLNIIDGQQRISTITLFLLILFQNFKNESNNGEKITNMREKLKKIIYDDEKNQKLNMNFAKDHEDQKVYKHIIKTKFFETEKSEQNQKQESKQEKLQKKKQEKELNKKYLKNNLFKMLIHIEEEIKIKIKSPEDIELKFNYLIENTEFVFIKTVLDKNNSSPNKIFESLNSTGRELTALDLIKNYIIDSYAYAREDTKKNILDKYWNKWEKLFNFPLGIEKINTKSNEFYNFFYVLTHINSNWIKNFKFLKGTDKKIYMHFKKKFIQTNHFEETDIQQQKVEEELEFIEKIVLIFYSFFELFVSKSKKKIEDQNIKNQAVLFISENKKLINLKTKRGQTISVNVKRNLLKCFGKEIKILILFFCVLYENQQIDIKNFKEAIEITSASELLLRIFRDKIGQLSVSYNRFIINFSKSITKSNEMINIIDFFKTPVNQLHIKDIFLKKIKKFWNNFLKKDSSIVEFLQNIKNEKANKEEIFNQFKSKKDDQKNIIIESILKFISDAKYKDIVYPTTEHIGSKLINKIGNLIILERKLNNQAGNNNLQDKLEFWKESENDDVQELKEYIEKEGVQKWNEEQINKREEKLMKKFFDKIKNIFESFSFD